MTVYQNNPLVSHPPLSLAPLFSKAYKSATAISQYTANLNCALLLYNFKVIAIEPLEDNTKGYMRALSTYSN